MTKFKAGDMARTKPMKIGWATSAVSVWCEHADGTGMDIDVRYLEPVPLPANPDDEEKVERVARAICKKFDYSHDDDKQFWREKAKAALEALRSTPSKAGA